MGRCSAAWIPTRKSPHISIDMLAMYPSMQSDLWCLKRFNNNCVTNMLWNGVRVSVLVWLQFSWHTHIGVNLWRLWYSLRLYKYTCNPVRTYHISMVFRAHQLPVSRSRVTILLNPIVSFGLLNLSSLKLCTRPFFSSRIISSKLSYLTIQYHRCIVSFQIIFTNLWFTCIHKHE